MVRNYRDSMGPIAFLPLPLASKFSKMVLDTLATPVVDRTCSEQKRFDLYYTPTPSKERKNTNCCITKSVILGVGFEAMDYKITWKFSDRKRKIMAQQPQRKPPQYLKDYV
ncbi:hypothetical protein JHK84_043986 [Glycine max]|nr:hypothetical protein JHK86_043796 [Glycine max]KAG4958084.1 hypothetical protein JHK85_044464 [Glycine max]KAG5117873.1 hypothetical protein JHK84_043986 [Glycine max]